MLSASLADGEGFAGQPDWGQIQQLCLQRGWDLGQLARAAGVSRTTLYQWQAQKTGRPRLQTLFKLAEALQVEPQELMLSRCDRLPAQTQTPSHPGTAPIPPPSPSPVVKQEAAPMSALPASSFLSGEDFWPSGLTDLAGQFDRQTNWCVQEVCERQPELFADWTQQEWDELFSSFGTGGELNEQGVLQQVSGINQRRTTVYELQVLLETHLAEATRRIIHSLYESVQCPGSFSEPESPDTR